MKRPLRFEFVIIVFGLLLAGCERPDTKLQKKLVGTWTKEDYFEMTFASKGSFQSKIVGDEKEATIAGNWFVSNSCLVLTITGKSDRNWSNSLSRISIGDIERGKIVSLDAIQFVMAMDGQTNTFNRK